jgi:hypothetical protein
MCGEMLPKSYGMSDPRIAKSLLSFFLHSSLVPRGIHYNTLVTFLPHFCNGLLCWKSQSLCQLLKSVAKLL